MGDSDIGALIRRRRKELKLTQQEMAKRAGLSGATVGRIERGEVEVKIHQVELVFAVLGLSLDAMKQEVNARLTLADCVNKIEFYVAELRKIISR